MRSNKSFIRLKIGGIVYVESSFESGKNSA